MHSAFNIVIWVVCILAVIVAFGALIASRKTWDDYGKGRFVMDHETPRNAGTAERNDEIRQLVVARNHRRMRAGKPPLDVEAEIEREIAALGGL